MRKFTFTVRADLNTNLSPAEVAELFTRELADLGAFGEESIQVRASAICGREYREDDPYETHQHCLRSNGHEGECRR